MPETLQPGDVEQYTRGRLAAADPETVRGLEAALARVRRYCGWHVSPVITETITLDGPGGLYLAMPTLKVVSINGITEDGTVLDLADVLPSADAPGILGKRGWGCWKRGFSAIQVDLTHGYSAAEAADFREAVLALVDRAAMAVGVEGGGAQLVEKEVDDVRYRWSDKVSQVTLDESAVNQYRILPV